MSLRSVLKRNKLEQNPKLSHVIPCDIIPQSVHWEQVIKLRFTTQLNYSSLPAPNLLCQKALRPFGLTANLPCNDLAMRKTFLVTISFLRLPSASPSLFMISRRFHEEISSLGTFCEKPKHKTTNICDLKWQIWHQRIPEQTKTAKNWFQMQ